MKFNWKARFKNRAFLVSLFSLLLLFVQQIASIFGVDTTLYNEQLTFIFNTGLSILVLLGIVVDPLTPQISDGERKEEE